jgi:hypothetical protein
MAGIFIFFTGERQFMDDSFFMKKVCLMRGVRGTV